VLSFATRHQTVLQASASIFNPEKGGNMLPRNVDLQDCTTAVHTKKFVETNKKMLKDERE
jgi:hypothetical protein